MSVLKRDIEVDAVVAMGGNLGDRAETLAAAARELAEADGVEVTGISSFYETVALRVDGPDPDAPSYLNAVVTLRTTRTPDALLALLHEIEDAHGRERTERWGDRTLDLDIVDFAGLRLERPDLTLPHPRAAQRDFVLRPWLELDADAVLAGEGRVADLLAALEAGA